MELHVIVHEHCIWDECEILHRNRRDLGRIPSILEEIQRIKREEVWTEVLGFDDLHHVRYCLRDVEKVSLSGAYGEMCVRNHGIALQRRGVAIEFHEKAILFAQKDLLRALPAVDFCYDDMEM